MKLSIESFYGDKDNYYNFKRNYLEGQSKLRISINYLNVGSKEDVVMKEILEKIDIFEFED